jgi:adenylosuccinate synthase
MFEVDRRCVVVVGAQWGDEGKGKLVDVLAEQADMVVRYQGGANAGHTVVVGEDEFILKQLPSGILHPGPQCALGNGIVLDLETFFGELDHLDASGVDTQGRVLVSERAHLVLPYHKLLDRAHERGQRIGTTGRGIGPAYEDKYGRRGLRVGELRDLIAVRPRLAMWIERVNGLLGLLGADERANLDEHMDLLESFTPRLLPMVVDTGLHIHRMIQSGGKVVLEGAQGAMLDVDHGTYPYVTSSNTTAGGAAVGVGIGPTCIDAVLGIVKAYTTRVGNGPLPTEAEAPWQERLRTLGGEFGSVTGRPRRCGWFDTPVAMYSARVNGLSHLAVTKLDVLDAFDEIPVAVAYEIDGERTTEVPADVAGLSRARPVYETVPGWRETITQVTRLADLPSPARHYLDRMQELVGVPIQYVSVGTRRDQIIPYTAG